VKAAPSDLVVTAGFLRCWTIAAGRPATIGYLLGLDPHAPDTYEPLAAACAAAGLAGSLLGSRGGGPAVRIVGYRRCSRLAEMIGTPPPEAPAGAFPSLGH
jgi:predicted MFS family arabinose efflux permease